METSSEEYVEPHCSWKRGKEFDTIEIDLDGFTREDVKLTIQPIGEEILVISIMAETPRRIQKKFEIPNRDYDAGKLRATMCSGNLSIEIPKKAASNKLEISKPKSEFMKVIQESGGKMQRKFSSGVECCSKPIVAVSAFTSLAIVLLAYKYYVKC
ncbi:HSP20-like chaperone [Corchorus capsularis]|uniref:HSP20-like chaperone n=1 Tax=Corchorus capsularis TaxID=210143 RepID=A0A1R3HC46_COCAP|nr:HSP20-like chaperone [Corchorus capsularis]